MSRSPVMNIAGQAVIEGVMFWHRHHIAMAVRKPDQSIGIVSQRYRQLIKCRQCLNTPILRGILVFIETLVLGLKMVSKSASLAMEGEEEQLSPWEIIFSIIISLGFVLVLFKLVPYASAAGLVRWIGGGNLLLNLAEGAIKILIFVLYLAIIGLLPDVRRMFQYHGAEHKTINCYESGKKVTATNILASSKRQPRCGTTFIIIVFIISIFFYVAIPFGFSFWTKYLLRVLLLPIIAGVSYELIKFAGRKYCSSKMIRILMAPGLWFQDLTTREPTKKQVEVAIAALKALPDVKI